MASLTVQPAQAITLHPMGGVNPKFGPSQYRESTKYILFYDQKLHFIVTVSEIRKHGTFNSLIIRKKIVYTNLEVIFSLLTNDSYRYDTVGLLLWAINLRSVVIFVLACLQHVSKGSLVQLFNFATLIAFD